MSFLFRLIMLDGEWTPTATSIRSQRQTITKKSSHRIGSSSFEIRRLQRCYMRFTVPRRPYTPTGTPSVWASSI